MKNREKKRADPRDRSLFLCRERKGATSLLLEIVKKETTWILQKLLLCQAFWQKEKEKTPILRPFYKGGFGILQRDPKMKPVKRKKGRMAPIHGKWEE